jgi:beta-glucosidase
MRNERVAALLAGMTLEEKVAQMGHDAPAIPRLGIPRYNWWNECLHGVARAGVATVFPQAIGLAATWNADLLYRIASAIADEGRAKFHAALARDIREKYMGITFWSPNINIFRDPRWGRGQETYGEDPFLTARLGVAFVRGLQGDHPRYLKSVATPKHFAVHSGPELERHRIDVQVGERDLRETYLPAFEACIREAGAASIMGAYNRVNGEPCCASRRLLCDILRGEWGFDGYVVSDCGAIRDIHAEHRTVATADEAAAMAVEAGCDLNCGEAYHALVAAVRNGQLAAGTIDRSVGRLLHARDRLGLLDTPDATPFSRIPISVVDCDAHRALAAQAARESLVLLKNECGLLPLDSGIGRVAVIGPTADSAQVLLGNYNGTPSVSVTPLEGIRRKLKPGCRLRYAAGCACAGTDRSGFAEAVAAASAADVAIVVMGLSPQLEGEEGEVTESDAGGDRLRLGLPGMQEALLQQIHDTGTPVVLVLTGGSALAVNWAAANVPAILQSWYGGEEAGTGLADVLFGDYNPGGRLPVTYYTGLDQLPPFDDYNMANRTYRYFRGRPLFPFGYGLSYTTFAYANLDVPETVTGGDPLPVRVEVTNTGPRAGDEVVQVYLSADAAPDGVPRHSLAAFQRIHLAPGEQRQVVLTVGADRMCRFDEAGRPRIDTGMWRVSVGGVQPGYEAATGGCTAIRSGSVRVDG